MSAPDAAGQIRAVMAGVAGFVADMRVQGIHVGMGSPPTCVTCDKPWPCDSGRSN